MLRSFVLEVLMFIIITVKMIMSNLFLKNVLRLKDKGRKRIVSWPYGWHNNCIITNYMLVQEKLELHSSVSALQG